MYNKVKLIVARVLTLILNYSASSIKSRIPKMCE